MLSCRYVSLVSAKLEGAQKAKRKIKIYLSMDLNLRGRVDIGKVLGPKLFQIVNFSNFISKNMY